VRGYDKWQEKHAPTAMIERATGWQGYLRAVRVKAFVKGSGVGRLLVDISLRNSVLKRLRRDGVVVVVGRCCCCIERDKPPLAVLPLVGIRDQLLTGSWRYIADHPDTNVRRLLSHFPGSGAFFRMRP
jgi:hypothetical protein